MTDLMETIYNYILEYRLTAYLNTSDYRNTCLLLPKHLETLYKELPDGLRQTFDKYRDAEDEHHNIELEAMFQAAFAVALELS